MTASAAEVEAAQKAHARHEHTVPNDIGENRTCLCGFDYVAEGVSFWTHRHQAVADAVVAAAQPRIAAETLREWALNACMTPVNARATFTGEQMGKTLLQRADRIAEAQS